jgi:antitoxin component YwqK of YwqJK toxin-antitoxin module
MVFASLFYEPGEKKEEELYVDGIPEKELIRYCQTGTKSALIPYKNGVPHGTGLEWYEKWVSKGLCPV